MIGGTGGSILKRIRKDFDLYLLLLPALICIIIFCYGPMYGVILAFKDYNPADGILGSPNVGFLHFKNFFNAYYFWDLIKNTLSISLFSIVVNTAFPIVFALMLNEVRNSHFKKIVQTVTYAPHFISMVVLVGMILTFLSPESGMISQLLHLAGVKDVNLITEPKYFLDIYVFSGLWQDLGWWSIIYVAVLAGVDPQLHEAATIDGASRLQRIRYINIPWLMPTIITLLILSTGGVLSVGFEKTFLMQNSLNLEVSEVISTYIYKVGLVQAQYGFSTAVNLFNSVINFILIFIVNTIAGKLGETSLW